MKKYLAVAVLLTSVSFSADIELYTSAVIKLVKENKKMTHTITQNQHNIVALKTVVSNSKEDKYLSSIKNKEFNIKSEEDNLYIAHLDTFLLNNQ